MLSGLTFLCLVATSANGAPAVDRHINDDRLWRVVARANLIVVGRLDVPVASANADRPADDRGYAKFRVSVDQTIKGSRRESLEVQWYCEGKEGLSESRRISAMNGKSAMLFLEQDAKGVYPVFDTDTAMAADREFVSRVRHEVMAQQEALRQVQKMFPSRDDVMFVKVKALIDRTVRADTQAAAFRDLEGLGQDAVPAIIMLMDDSRKLARREITLRNSAGSRFEGFRHYGPETVADAMDAILNQITGEDFGFIANGATEEERRRAVDGWRIYLYHVKNDARPIRGK